MVLTIGIPKFLDCGRWTLDSGPWALDAGIWTLGFSLCTLDSGRWTLDSGGWKLHLGNQALGTRRCCRLVQNKIRTQFLILLFRNFILTLNVTLSRNTERNFYCEKLNYITNSQLRLFSSSRLEPVYSENTGFQVLLLVNLQTDC